MASDNGTQMKLFGGRRAALALLKRRTANAASTITKSSQNACVKAHISRQAATVTPTGPTAPPGLGRSDGSTGNRNSDNGFYYGLHLLRSPLSFTCWSSCLRRQIRLAPLKYISEHECEQSRSFITTIKFLYISLPAVEEDEIMARKHAAGVDKRQTVEDAFRHILLANLSAVHEWEPVAVKGGDVEGVHQMRVRFRRMRSALSAFRPAVPRKVTAPFAQDMRQAGKTLDDARDLNVYIADNFSSKGGKAPASPGSFRTSGRSRPKSCDGSWSNAGTALRMRSGLGRGLR